MENENSIKEIIRNSLEEVRSILDADTVIGQPVYLENGTTIIPISRVSMGFASGGLDLPDRQAIHDRKNFGGGGGTGVTVYPVGFLTSYPDGRVEVLPLKQEYATPLEQIVDLINRAPDLIDKIREILDGNFDENELGSRSVLDRLLRRLRSEEFKDEKPSPEEKEREREARKEAALEEKRRNMSFDYADED